MQGSEMEMHSERRFNLVDENWIPVAGEGLVSLRRVFTDHNLMALGGNPVEKIALTKLLLAIAQTAYTPKNDDGTARFSEIWEFMCFPGDPPDDTILRVRRPGRRMKPQ